MNSLLAQHADTDGVAFGALGERSAADLLRDAGAVAHALPARALTDAAGTPLALIGVRRDRYAFAAALLGAWARGYDVLLPAVDVSREAFLRLAQCPDVTAVLHDTLSSAALPIDRILGAAQPEQALSRAQLSTALAGEGRVLVSGRSLPEGAEPRALRRSQLLAEARDAAAALQLPDGAACWLTSLPETRYALTLGVLWPLLSGGALWRDDPRDPSWPAHLLEHAGISPSPRPRVLIGVPAHVRALARAPHAALDVFSHVVSGSAPLPAAAFRALERHPQLRVSDVYVSEKLGVVGFRQTADADFQPLPGLEAEPFRASETSSELEERVAWLDGVSDAALLPAVAADAGARLAVTVSEEADQHALRAAIARVAPQLSLAELRFISPRSAPADPVGVASFSGGVRGLRRDGAGRHDRAGLFRLFGLSADGKPLVGELRFGASQERDGKHVTQLTVPEGYVYFAGHFPGYPLLPGAAQLSEMVLPCVRRARPELGRLVRMVRLKFQERIMPGDSIEVVLTFLADPAQLDFSLVRDGALCAAGRLGFHPNAEAGT